MSARDDDGYEEMLRIEDPSRGEDFETEEGVAPAAFDGDDAARLAEAELGGLGTGAVEDPETRHDPDATLGDEPRHKRR